MIAKLGGTGHLGHVADKVALTVHGHVTVTNNRCRRCRLMSIGQPFGQTAVQNRDVLLAHQSEQPPNACSREQAVTIINNHLMPVTDAHRAHARHELFDGRHGMRQL